METDLRHPINEKYALHPTAFDNHKKNKNHTVNDSLETVSFPLLTCAILVIPFNPFNALELGGFDRSG